MFPETLLKDYEDLTIFINYLESLGSRFRLLYKVKSIFRTWSTLNCRNGLTFNFSFYLILNYLEFVLALFSRSN